MPRSRHLPTHTRSMSSWHMATKREQLIFFNCLNLVDLPRTSTLIWVNSFSYVQTPRVKPHSVVPKGQRHLLIKFETQLKAFFSLLIVETLWFFINLSHPTTQIGYHFFGTRKVIESNFHIVLVEKKNEKNIDFQILKCPLLFTFSNFLNLFSYTLSSFQDHQSWAKSSASSFLIWAWFDEVQPSLRLVKMETNKFANSVSIASRDLASVLGNTKTSSAKTRWDKGIAKYHANNLKTPFKTFKSNIIVTASIAMQNK